MNTSIVLIGFMAVGKSTVGQLLAEALDVPFVDTDTYIEQKAGLSIPCIFEAEGEAYFRRLEQESIQTLLREKHCVIATGGGLPCTNENIDLIKNNSQSVWLDLGKSKIVDRLVNSTDRPLAKSQSKKELMDMVNAKMAIRRSYYKQADIHVMAHGEPKDIVRRILKKLDQ